MVISSYLRWQGQRRKWTVSSGQWMCWTSFRFPVASWNENPLLSPYGCGQPSSCSWRCYTHPTTPACTAHEELELHFLLLKREVKERWPRKWKSAHWALWPPVSDRLAGSFSCWKHMIHWITEKMETWTHLNPVKLLFLMMWQLCHLLLCLTGDNKHPLRGGHSNSPIDFCQSCALV